MSNIRAPHAFTNAALLASSIGKTVAVVGKVEKVESDRLVIKSSDGK